MSFQDRLSPFKRIRRSTMNFIQYYDMFSRQNDQNYNENQAPKIYLLPHIREHIFAMYPEVEKIAMGWPAHDHHFLELVLFGIELTDDQQRDLLNKISSLYVVNLKSYSDINEIRNFPQRPERINRPRDTPRW